MKKFASCLVVGLLLCSTAAWAQDAKSIKAVMYVGGGFHDYKTMPGYLTQKVSAIANIQFDIKPVKDAAQMAQEYKDPKFGQGYDLIVFDICFGEAWNDGDYDPVLKLVADGRPAIFLHCSMHTYRPPRDTKAANYKEREVIADAKWHALLGMDTRVHDKFEGFSTVKAAKDHPILKTFPDDWKTPGDELYNTVKMMPTATPLLTSKSPQSGNLHTVAWVNTYKGTRVFATTLGHDMKTGEDAAYHQLLASGMLWAAGKLGDDGKPSPGYAAAH